MSKELMVIVLGVWLIVETQLGIPDSWHTALLIITGLAFIALGFSLRSESLARGGRRQEHQPFVESSNRMSDPHSHEHQEGITSLN